MGIYTNMTKERHLLFRDNTADKRKARALPNGCLIQWIKVKLAVRCLIFFFSLLDLFFNLLGENFLLGGTGEKHCFFCCEDPSNRPFLSCLVLLFQSESWCTAFHMKISFHSHANKTFFHMKGCAPRLALKKRYKTTRKWPINEFFTR